MVKTRLFSLIFGGAVGSWVVYMGYTASQSRLQFLLFVILAFLVGNLLRLLTQRTIAANYEAAQRGESS